MKKSSGVVVAALAVATLWTVAPAAAAPIGSPRLLQTTVEPSVEMVRYRRGYGPAIGLGIAGALIGGAIIGATQPTATGTPATMDIPAITVRPTSCRRLTRSRRPMSAAAPWPIVRSATGPMTPIPGPISATTAIGILAPDGGQWLIR